ncbi:ATP-dependent Clp protease ATP-binding subunit ClpX, partial [Bacteroides thetaiotaomicron]|nr:ATP-dependent Clp protease ATP-binding subunit ClpX [Bacteroides thetaiotaomicron]
GTGARGLRAIMEELLVPGMYDIPDREDVSRVVVTAASVRGEEQPQLVIDDEEKTA